MKKKKKLLKFQKKNHQDSTLVKPKYYNNTTSPFKTNKSWRDFKNGKCPQHGKSEYGSTISGENWYWCKPCRHYTRDHTTSGHASWEESKNGYTPQQAAAKAASPRAPPTPAMENVASAPAIPPQTQEEPDENIPIEAEYNYETDEDE